MCVHYFSLFVMSDRLFNNLFTVSLLNYYSKDHQHYTVKEKKVNKPLLCSLKKLQKLGYVKKNARTYPD